MLDSYKCPKCGCKGLHACIGFIPEPMTSEEQARLEQALELVSQSIGERIEKPKHIKPT